MTVEHTNPFFEPYNTPHATVPFDRIQFEDFEPAMREGMQREDEEIQCIVNNPEPPTFENTIETLDRSGEMLGRVTTVFFNLLSAETTDDLDALAQRMSPLLSEHENNIMLNEDLFARVKAVYDASPADLSPEQRMLLEKTYEGFRRAGALLDEAGKSRLRALTAELSRLSLQFSQNNLKENQNFYLHLTDEAQLSGLPESQREQAAQAAREKGLDGWVITLDAPSYVPFMMYANSRELRQRLYMAYNTKCTHDDAFNNFEIVSRLVNLRRELAQLLGYPTYADYALKRRMAGTTGNVYRLLDDLIDAYRPAAVADVEAVAAKARQMEEPGFEIQPWDFAYYAHKLKLERYDFDAEMLRPYFELSRVKQGIFGLAERLYGITFRRNPDIPVYHPDVVAYDVFDAETSQNAVRFLSEAMNKHFIQPRCLVLHSDNGAAMKAAETLGLLAVRGVEFSHSRPRVSNDNPYSESLFKTMKYTGHMGKRNYHSLEECQGVLADFARKYNEQWVHSGINNVTPLARFSGADAAICKARRQVMAKARQQHPERWIYGRMRNYEPAGSQWLNPDRQVLATNSAT